MTGGTDTPGSGFPGTGGSPIQSTFGGGSQDAFVTKLNATGTAILYSTYLGGSGLDLGNGIAVDQAGQAYVTGIAGSGFPGTAGSLIQSTFGGDSDAFVAKIRRPSLQFAALPRRIPPYSGRPIISLFRSPSRVSLIPAAWP